MLQFKGLNISVNGKKLFESDNLSISDGLFALVGRNGTGKSTLLKTVMGLHEEYGGNILIGDRSVSNYKRTALAQEIAIVYTRSTVFGNHTGRDVLYLGRLPYQNTFAQKSYNDRDVVNQTVELLRLQDFVDRSFNTLSDGEKQLVMIGRALVQDTRIILLDEPGAFLDLVNKHIVLKVLKDIAQSTEKLILFSTHDVGVLGTLCNGVLLIENEKLHLLNNPKTFEKDIYKSFGLEKMI